VNRELQVALAHKESVDRLANVVRQVRTAVLDQRDHPATQGSNCRRMVHLGALAHPDPRGKPDPLAR